MKEFKANMLIYLANRYSSDNPDKDLASLERAQRRSLESSIGGRLKKKYGVTLILPIAVSAAMVDLNDFSHGFKEWENDDYTFISKCDAVWVLNANDWPKSIGVTAEIVFAEKHNIPVQFVDPHTLKIYNNARLYKGLMTPKLLDECNVFLLENIKCKNS